MILFPSHMGRLNRRALLRQLQKSGVASRAHLAKALGMSQPTAGKIVDDLLALEVVEEVEMPPSEVVQLGRPGRLLRLNQSKAQLLGIQLGITETTVAALSLGMPDEDRWQHTFTIGDAKSDPAKTWKQRLQAAAKKIGTKHFLGALLSVPGVVEEAGNRIIFSPNIHWTEKADLAAMVQSVWNLPVLMVQEERALALGHQLANPDYEDFLLVDFGEGVGGAIIVGGKPLANSLPISGEIGHTPVMGNARKCGCGATGCMETLVSIRGLLESFVQAVPRAKNSWADLNAHIARQGVEPWLAESLKAAAAAIAGALNVLGLRRVVVTGCLQELPPAVVDYLSNAIKGGAMWARFGEVECVSAPRRRIAGLVAMGIDHFVVPEDDAPESSRAKTSRRI